MNPDQPSQSRLKRSVGLVGAMMTGLGSILGTGIFVSFGLAAGLVGNWILVAIIVAAALALLNSLSSSQLATAHPANGGAYEFGYRFANAPLGFLAGWMFLIAKSSSAATAALGFSAYFTTFFLLPPTWKPFLAPVLIVGVTGLILGGIKNSIRVTTGVVISTISVLLLYALAVGAPSFDMPTPIVPQSPEQLSGRSFGSLLQATALMFVAFSGYARITVLAEEMKDPETNIPRAMMLTLAITTGLYMLVSHAALTSVGSEFLLRTTLENGAPLAMSAMALQKPWLAGIVTVGAAIALFGVLLNLILALSRVILAMGRRRDLPAFFQTLNPSQTSPWIAVLFTSLMVAALASFGSVKLNWSLAAFTVLIYYGITHVCAIMMAEELRRFPVWTAWTGLFCCLVLAFSLDSSVWGSGVLLGFAGLIYWTGNHFLRKSPQVPSS